MSANDLHSSVTAAARDKVVLVKGCYGMGGRLLVLATGMKFAHATGRRLVVDWNDGYYDDGKDTRDVFSHYIAHPISDAAAFYWEYDLAGAAVYPPVWAGRELSVGRHEYGEHYRLPPPVADIAEADIVVITGPKVTRQECSDGLRAIRFAPRIEERAGAFFEATFPRTAPIGVHVRHGNGEDRVLAPRVGWFIDQVRALRAQEERPVFLATDSGLVVEYFQQHCPDVFVFAKEYAPEGPLHNNRRGIRDPFQAGDAALTDMLLLAKCPTLLSTGHYFGIVATYLGAGRDQIVQYPEKNRTGPDVPGIPAVADKAWNELFTAHGIRADNVRLLETPEGISVYYGYDEMVRAAARDQIPWGELREQLIHRRLYA